MKKRLFAFILFLIIGLSTEMILRLQGFSPSPGKSSPPKIIASPSPVFQFDSLLGFAQKPGDYTITLNGTLAYQLGIDSAGSRKIPGLYPPQENKIGLYGCSFWAGMGVNDNQVLSYFLQQKTDSFHIQNMAIPGHGMTSEYLLLKDQIRRKTAPRIAVFSMASFHLIRNPAGYAHTKNFGKIPDGPAFFPAAYYTDNNTLATKIIRVPEKYRPGATFSAGLNALYNILDQHEYSPEWLLKLQLDLMDSTFSLCRKEGIEPLFVLITRDDISEKIYQHGLSGNYPMLWSDVNYKDNRFHLYPHDGHPNAAAHQLYAEEIYQYIQKRYAVK